MRTFVWLFVFSLRDVTISYFFRVSVTRSRFKIVILLAILIVIKDT